MATARKRLTALLLAPLLVIALAAAAVLTDPEPIDVPDGLAPKAIDKAIRLGALQRGWIISERAPGQLEATLNIRSHQAKVAVEFDSERVVLRYLSSSNLDYAEKKGVRYIHANYEKWVRNLRQDIATQLQMAQLQQH